MNKNLIMKAMMGVAASCSLFLSSCVDDPYWSSNVSVGYNNSGYLYDNVGYPVFGYDGGRPVYAYDPYGRPVYSINLIYSNYCVPSWRPAPHYHGHYHYRHPVRRMSSPPRGYHGRLERPSHDYNRPSRPSRPDFGSSNRPGSSGSSNRPSRPDFGSSNRPGSSGSSNRPSRPDFGSSNRPGSSGSSNRPSRPAGSSMSGITTRPSRVEPSSFTPSARTAPAVSPSAGSVGAGSPRSGR